MVRWRQIWFATMWFPSMWFSSMWFSSMWFVSMWFSPPTMWFSPPLLVSRGGYWPSYGSTTWFSLGGVGNRQPRRWRWKREIQTSGWEKYKQVDKRNTNNWTSEMFSLISILVLKEEKLEKLTIFIIWAAVDFATIGLKHFRNKIVANISSNNCQYF